ncbi:unnamed protein product, partial [Durusdinium trenchii]
MDRVVSPDQMDPLDSADECDGKDPSSRPFNETTTLTEGPPGSASVDLVRAVDVAKELKEQVAELQDMKQLLLRFQACLEGMEGGLSSQSFTMQGELRKEQLVLRLALEQLARRLALEQLAVALLDGGATNGLRRARPHEMNRLVPVTVELASGSTTLFRVKEHSTLLTKEQVEVIVPLHRLVKLGLPREAPDDEEDRELDGEDGDP